MLKELKLAIMERLIDKMGDRLEIGNHPDRGPGDVRGGLARAYVGYSASNFSPAQGSGYAQDRELQFSVYIETEDLYNDDDVLDLMEEIQNWLTGWTPEGANDAMRPTGDQPLRVSNQQTFAREARFTVPTTHTFQRRYR